MELELRNPELLEKLKRTEALSAEYLGGFVQISELLCLQLRKRPVGKLCGWALVCGVHQVTLSLCGLRCALPWCSLLEAHDGAVAGRAATGSAVRGALPLTSK